MILADSNAILVYLALAYDARRLWYPADPAGAASVQRWLSVAAGPLIVGPAYARLVGIFNAEHDLNRAHSVARQLFEIMEVHLRLSRTSFTGHRPTIGDIALYTNTAHAPEGHIDLSPYPAIRDWLGKIQALPGYVGMIRTEPRFGLPL